VCDQARGNVSTLIIALLAYARERWLRRWRRMAEGP